MPRLALLILLPVLLAHLAAAEPDRLQRLIDEAIRSGQPQATIPPGTYRSAVPIQVRGARTLTLLAEGASLVITAPKEGALAISDCTDLVVQGLRIDYDPLPFTQGVLTAIGDDGRTADFAIDAGYPDLDADYAVRRLHLFTADGGRWKPGAPDAYCDGTEIVDPRHGRSRFRDPQPYLAVGDRVALNLRGSRAITVRSCPGDVTLRDMRIHAAPGLAIMQRFCRGRLHVDGVRIERGTPPAGAVAGRLLAGNADGLNVAYGRLGPVLTGCDFSYIGDDSLNIHGIALPVVQVDSPTSVVVARPDTGESYDRVCDAGDAVRLLAAGDFAIQAQVPLASIRRLAGNPGIDPASLAGLHYRKTDDPVFWRVELAAPAPVAVGGWIDLPAIAPPHWRVVGNHFHDHRGRGLRLMASHGLVEGNRFARIKQGAITIGAEYAFWREAGWVEDVTVRGNRITDVFTGAMPAEADYAPGAIAVFVRLDRTGGPYPPLHRRIAITGNDIQGSGAAGILAYAVTDLTVADNAISGAAGVPAGAAARHGLPLGVVAIASP